MLALVFILGRCFIIIKKVLIFLYLRLYFSGRSINWLKFDPWEPFLKVVLSAEKLSFISWGNWFFFFFSPLTTSWMFRSFKFFWVTGNWTGEQSSGSFQPVIFWSLSLGVLMDLEWNNLRYWIKQDIKAGRNLTEHPIQPISCTRNAAGRKVICSKWNW